MRLSLAPGRSDALPGVSGRQRTMYSHQNPIARSLLPGGISLAVLVTLLALLVYCALSRAGSPACSVATGAVSAQHGVPV